MLLELVDRFPACVPKAILSNTLVPSVDTKVAVIQTCMSNAVDSYSNIGCVSSHCWGHIELVSFLI